MTGNRFLTDKYAKQNNLYDSMYTDYRRLQGVILCFTELQVYIDQKNTYKALLDNVDAPEKPYFSCPNPKFIEKKNLGLNFIKFLSENPIGEKLSKHPYMTAINELDCLSDPSFPLTFGRVEDHTPVFDIENYIKLICNVNEKGEIVGYSDSIKKGTYDKQALAELKEATKATQLIYETYNDEAYAENKMGSDGGPARSKN